MKRFVEGGDRRQTTLLPDCVGDYVTEERMLLDQFGDAYRTYMERTGRVLPRPR